MGRCKKNQGNPETAMKELIAKAVLLYKEPYDDRLGRTITLPSVRSVADEMETTILRTRKLLITAGYYSSAISRRVATLLNEGKSTEEVMTITGLKKASIYSYVPYKGLAFNLNQTTANADRHKLYRKRIKAVEDLKKHNHSMDGDEYLWSAILVFEGYPFRTAKGLRYSYQLKTGRNGQKTDELIFDRIAKEITKSSVLLAYRRALEIQESEGCVKGPKKLGVFGASYLYPMFIRFGVINSKSKRELIRTTW